MAVPSSLEENPLQLSVKAGTFIIMHQNMWHRGTKELVGSRRIMLKVGFVFKMMEFVLKMIDFVFK